MPEHCPECGAEMTAGAELCPRCLLQVGLETRGQPGETTLPFEAETARPNPLPAIGGIFGPYRIHALLGRGGMGTVYDAEHLESGRRVALKVLTHSLDSPEAQKRFLREGRLAASINHPNCVYVYGTEEIDGTPAISMELVAGGTLQDLVREQGPMPAARAVDTILEVIAGLEAAQSIGILHRDIKPANCYRDLNGSVKVGDFGLSISTTGRADSMVTADGSFIGTPAFSSPEQIRGEELNVRSDIYAVGVTLYFLLTGKTPFMADNVVQLLATILERKPVSPARWNPSIPASLCRTTLRCLEKQSGDRFKDYAELRKALRPFSSASPTPATLGLRFLAGVLDLVMFSVPTLVALSFPGVRRTFFSMEQLGGVDMQGFYSPVFLRLYSFTLFFWLLYFAVTESVWGASLGKRICRLRVVTADRSNPPFSRSLLRAALFVLPTSLPHWIYFLPSSVLTYNQTVAMGASYAYYVLLALMFSTARRRNGFSGIHDLLSKTQVMASPPHQERIALPTTDEPPNQVEVLQKIGPYHILESMGRSGDADLHLAYDTRLLRKVWVRKVPPGTPPVLSHLRNLARVGRLRWLNGRRDGKDCWDAYEAAPGKALLDLVDAPQPWSRVRGWLLDLARELQAAESESASPSGLSLDRVWICNNGQAKLLDFPAPWINRGPGPTFAGPAFLDHLARAALTGRKELEAVASEAPIALPLPVHARSLLERLREGMGLKELVEALEPIQHRLARVTRLRRAGLVLACVAFPLISLLFYQLTQTLLKDWDRRQPEVGPMWYCIFMIEMQERRGEPAKAEKRGWEILLATEFRSAVENPASWNSVYARSFLTPDQHRMATNLIQMHADPSPEERAQAKALLQSIGPAPWIAKPASGFRGLMLIMMLVIWLAIPTLAAAVTFRGGLLLLLLKMAVVRKDGSRASRWRLLWRAMLVSSPLVAVMILIAGNQPEWGFAAVLGMIAVALLLTCLPGRSLQDRLAGTCLVPR